MFSVAKGKVCAGGGRRKDRSGSHRDPLVEWARLRLRHCIPGLFWQVYQVGRCRCMCRCRCTLPALQPRVTSATAVAGPERTSGLTRLPRGIGGSQGQKGQKEEEEEEAGLCFMSIDRRATAHVWQCQQRLERGAEIHKKGNGLRQDTHGR